MIITHFEISSIKIALKTPFITALRRVAFVESVRLFIHTDTGAIGIGEAPPTKAITGEDAEDIIHTLKHIIMPQLIGHHLDTPSKLFDTLHNSCEAHTSAKAAVDIAIYDLLSKKAGLASYLGAKTETVQTDVTISLNAPKKMAEDAQRAVADTFTVLKVKVGAKDGADIQRIQAVCEAVPNATILLDANQAWSLAEAIQILEHLHYPNIALVEQPLMAQDLKGMKVLTQLKKLPILADESAFNLSQVKTIVQTQSANMINIKLMKCGGIYKAIEIIKYCKEKHIKCMMGSMLEGPYSIAAAIALVLAYPEVFIYCDLDSPQLYKELPHDAPMILHNDTLTLR